MIKSSMRNRLLATTIICGTAFAGLPVQWLPCSAGDDQVLLLTREALALWGPEAAQ